ncbi:MAG: hypothetical protein EHM36_10955 [Deltaproteobacteria bacterium]|nr:MAG: hypothetical protein EHM36_10955 [Deltaproteobacteria bacterium]
MGSFFADKRGFIKNILSFYTLKTVPTIRLSKDGTALEIGKRARLRENSLVDSLDGDAWDIQSRPVLMTHRKNAELGYILHPAGVTVEIKPTIKIVRADENGNLIGQYDKDGNFVGYKYVDVNFEGTVGKLADLDDFNESTERETSRGWILPLIIGIGLGVMVFAPMFAWLMGMAGG